MPKQHQIKAEIQALETRLIFEKIELARHKTYFHTIGNKINMGMVLASAALIGWSIKRSGISLKYWLRKSIELGVLVKKLV
ncbi:MAG: hypothetical protein K2X39_07705 [Silvanigrellaceae bacterium]|nr:hypothetical protein [Silvanigrellaceae bacterium]